MAAAVTVSLRVVPVAAADLETVAGVVNRAFDRYSDLFRGPRTSAKDYADEAGEEARVILVEGGEGLLATSMIAAADRFFEGESGEHPWSGALYFGLAGVEPKTMNRGLGRMMVGQAETLARAEGFAKVVLGTVREFGLVDYYEKLNYEVVHEEEFPPGHWGFFASHHYCEMVKAL